MFEFHAWAVIRTPEREKQEFSQILGPEDLEIKKLRQMVNKIHDEVSIFEVKRSSNGMVVFFAHGLRNHRYEPVVDVFRWIAENFRESYGLLYVHDDEDKRGSGQEYASSFRVWRLALGDLSEESDPFLSPYIPTVELPYEEST